MASASSRLVLLVAAVSTTLGVLSSTIFLPSFPDMARALGAPIEHVQLTLTVFLLVFAFGMPVAGPLSDRFGRRRVLLAGLWTYLVGSLIGAWADDIATVLFARVLQAAGSCTGVTVARAVVRDLFDRPMAAKALSAIAMVTASTPVVAPLIGGVLHNAFGWRANFVAPALVTGVVLILARFGMPETRAGGTPTQGLLGAMGSSYRLLLGSRRFLAYCLALTGGMGGYYAFATAAPGILIERLGVPVAMFGFYSAMPSLGFIAGSFVSNRTTLRLGIDRLIGAGTVIQCVSALVLVALAVWGPPQPLMFTGPMIVFGFGNGLVSSNAFAGCVSFYPRIAGAAAGLSGFMQTIGGTAGTIAITLLPRQDPMSVGLVIAACAIPAAIAYHALGRGAPPPAPS